MVSLTCVTYHLYNISNSSTWSFFILPGHVSEILVLPSLFAHSGQRKHVQPGIPQALQKQWELADPPDNLNVSSSCSGKLLKNPEEHTLSSFDALMSQRVCEILDSIGGSQMLSVKKFFVPLCISDKSVLQCWFSFFWFKHCKVQPVNDQLLILERRRWSVRKIGIFVVIPLPALHWSVDSAINSKRGLEFVVFVFHREVMKIFLIITHHWLGISKQHPLTREPDPPLFSTSATTLCLLNLFLMCKPCVTKYSRHYTRIHKIVMILCFLWIVSNEGVWKMMTGRIVSMNSLCRHDARKQGSMCGNWPVGLEPNKHQGKMIHTRERPNGQWQQNWQKWREVRCC